MVEKICDNCMSRVPADAEKCPKCGIQFENTNPGGALPNGWVLDERYTIGRYIDIDGEGVTYAAIDGDTLQRVVVKEFMPVTLCASRTEQGQIVAKPGCDVLFKTTRMDFVELYASLLDIGLSEGLVQVLDIFEVNNTAYAVLEKVEGPTLAEYLNRKQDPMEYSSVLTMLRSILVGTQTLHNANIVHRGISPENIVLESGGTAKLTGYATLALRQQGTELKPKLYPSYSAPEQYSASEFEGKYTDIYSLGAVMYRMVTGEVPPAADERRIQDTLRAPRSMNKEIPNFISNSIMKALRMNSAERIQTVTDFRMALSGESMRGNTTTNMPAVKGTYPFGLNQKQFLVGAIIAGALVVILLIVLFVSIFSGGKSKNISSSSSSVSSAVQVTVPNFVGKQYAEIQTNSSYNNFTFDVTKETSDSVEAGLVISQTPDANTTWDGKTNIKLVVSTGKEAVDMPNLVKKNLDEAKAELIALGFKDSDIVVTKQDNDGSYAENEVTTTNPEAGTKITPGTEKITLLVAGPVSSTTMPDVTGDPKDTATKVLISNGIKQANITTATVANDKGRGANGTVQSTDPKAGSTIVPGTQSVTINLYEDYKMPSLDFLADKSLEEAKAYCDERKIPYTVSTETVANNGNKTQGNIAQVIYTSNVVVTDSTVVTFKVYGAPPTTPPASSSSNATSSSEAAKA